MLSRRLHPSLLCAGLLWLCWSGAWARALLSYEALMKGRYPQSVALAAFQPDGDPAPPRNRFEGSLRLRGAIRSRMLIAEKGFIDAAGLALARTLPQDFDYEFVQQDGELLPVRRGPLPSAHGWWEFILEPGRVWDEPADAGYSRAVLPFSLQEKNANCTHHGLLSFLFRSDGRISHAALQVSGETCRYLQLDLWGMLQANYRPHRVSARERVLEQHRRETAYRLPERPLAQLELDYPGIHANALALGAPDSRTLYGLVVNGSHYVSACSTRAGDYGYCEVLDLPSYSTAKSVFAALALMRLQALTGSAAGELIRSWVPEPQCQTEAWAGVRFEDALDMATGNYDSAAFEADENDPKTEGLFLPLDHAHKIAFSCGAYPHRVPAGTQWNYHSSDTYVLGSALNAYFRSLPGHAGQDIYTDLLVAELFKPLNLSPVMLQTRRTYDAVAQAFAGWGLTYHRDDVARIALFLLRDGGRMDGHSMLDEAMLSRALQRVPALGGLPVPALPGFRYQDGFWARDVQRLIGCEHPVWVPFMSGFGGISMVLFPNGVVFYSFADDDKVASFDWGPAAIEVQKLGDMCSRD